MTRQASNAYPAQSSDRDKNLSFSFAPQQIQVIMVSLFEWIDMIRKWRKQLSDQLINHI